MQAAEPNYYAVLGLDRDCSAAHVRAAYRLLAKQHHPDVNPDSLDAKAQTQALNAAYEILSDPERRKVYDQRAAMQQKQRARSSKSAQNINQEMHLRFEEFLRGTSLQVRVMDAATGADPEQYQLNVPPNTAPGTRFRLPRTDGGFVSVKTRAQPDFRFRARGSDLRCDLRISFERARKGGTESVRGVTGNFLRVPIPAGIARGEIIRLVGEGLPKPRGGRGDLLVRVQYRPEVRITRSARR